MVQHEKTKVHIYYNSSYNMNFYDIHSTILYLRLNTYITENGKDRLLKQPPQIGVELRRDQPFVAPNGTLHKTLT